MPEKRPPWGQEPNWAGLALAAGLFGLLWYVSNDDLAPNKRPDNPNQLWLFEQSDVPRYLQRSVTVAETSSRGAAIEMKRWLRTISVPSTVHRRSPRQWYVTVARKHEKAAKQLLSQVSLRST